VEMFNCESSLIARYGYDREREQLELDFHKGGVYRYFDVPESIFREFLAAQSKGKFFLKRIKGVYSYEKT
jgi:KTSC domain